MILADTSVWIDHFRTGDDDLAGLLMAAEIVAHPWVIAELTLGGLPAGSPTVALLRSLVTLPVAADSEVMSLIETRSLAGRGIGFVDAHLLAATVLRPGVRLWTRDKRLAAVAADLSVAV